MTESLSPTPLLQGDIFSAEGAKTVFALQSVWISG